MFTRCTRTFSYRRKNLITCCLMAFRARTTMMRRHLASPQKTNWANTGSGLTDHGIFYSQALFNDIVFELTLEPAWQVVRGSEPLEVKYKLTNIQLEYEMKYNRNDSSNILADEVLTNSKEFAYDNIQHSEVVTFAKGTDPRLNLRVNLREKVPKRHLATICRALCCWHKALRNVLKPRLDKSERHSKRLTKHAVQQRAWRNWYLGRGQTLLCQRKKIKHKAWMQKKILYRKQVGTTDWFALHRRWCNSRERHTACQHKIWSRTGAREEWSGSGNVNCHIYVISYAQMNMNMDPRNQNKHFSVEKKKRDCGL